MTLSLIFLCASMCQSIQAKYICLNEYYSYIFGQQTQFSLKIESGLRITVDPISPNKKSGKTDVGFLRYKHSKVKYAPIPRYQYCTYIHFGTGLLEWMEVLSCYSYKSGTWSPFQLNCFHHYGWFSTPKTYHRAHRASTWEMKQVGVNSASIRLVLWNNRIRIQVLRKKKSQWQSFI